MDFENKKIAILGVGSEGVSTLKFLLDKKAKISLLDKKAHPNLTDEDLQIIKNANIETIFGEEYLKSLENFDIIFRSPGIYPFSPELEKAKEKGIQITSQTRYFFDTSPGFIVGVTGTKGKGTTSTLIYEMLRKSGKDAYLGGNIGVPSLDFLEKLDDNSITVLELSSFQLIDLEKSPQLAVVLMITTEHQDWHKGNEEYTEAKKNIVKFQNSEDIAVINVDYPNSKEFENSTKAKIIFYSTKEKLSEGLYYENNKIYSTQNGDISEIIERNQVQLLGNHNIENVQAATAAALALKIGLEDIREVLRTFKGLPYRLELIATKKGVGYYNDSFSTNPETTIAAIRSFNSPEILIVGGSSKNSDFSDLGREISNSSNIKALILIGKEGSRIKEAVETSGGFKGEIIENLKNMQEIVSQAEKIAEDGDVVLLSPACASFDMFKNYKDRGDQFREVVKILS